MPPINVKQPSPQNPSPVSHPSRVPQIQQPSPASLLQSQNPSSQPGGISISSGTTTDPQVQTNSQPSFTTPAMPISNLTTLESKAKSETEASFPLGFNHLSSHNLNQSKNQIQPTRLSNLQNQPNIQSPSSNENQSSIQNLPLGSVDYKQISNPVGLQGQSHSSLNLNQNFQQPMNPNFQQNQNLPQSQSNNQIFQTPQTSIPKSHSQNFGSNPPNPSSQPFQNKMGSQNLFSVPNIKNAPPMQNVSSAQTMFVKVQPISQKTGSSPRFVPPMGNQYGIQPPMQNVPNIQNIQKLQNPQGGQNVQSVKNVQQSILGGQTNVLGGSPAPPQGQHLYSTQQNLTSQVKYPQNNPYGAAQLTNTNLPGPPLTNQQPLMTNFQTGLEQKPLSGIPAPPGQQVSSRQNYF